jgi:hypothetical protein
LRRSRRLGARSKALGAVKYDSSRRVPTRFSPSCELAGRLAGKSHAAPLTGANSKAASALALARANCPELARSRLVERSVPHEARAGECGFGPKISHNHVDFRGKNRAGPARSGCLSAVVTERKAGGLWSQQLRKLRRPDSPRPMPKTRSAERGLMGADENMRSSLTRRAWNDGGTPPISTIRFDTAGA